MAKEKTEQIETTTPTNTYADQLADAVSKATDRSYTYNWNQDKLYNDYKKEYMTEAQKARAGVINQGLRLSGGYGNDFSQSVGEQQYKTYLTNINRLAPTFENLQYAQYQGDTDNLINQLKLLLGRDETEYGRGRDNISDERTYRDYNKSNDQFNMNLALNLSKLENSKDSANKDYELMDYKQKLQDYIKQKEEEEAAARAAASRGRSGGGYGSGYGGSGDYSYSQSTGSLGGGLANGVSGAINAAQTAVANSISNLRNSRMVTSYDQGGIPVYTSHGGYYNGMPTPAEPTILGAIVSGVKSANKWYR